MLSTADHARDKAGLTYVYPVLSRRSGGLSIGINLNINHACNWACIYCQVPNLIRGSAPAIDLAKLRDELSLFLDDVLTGTFYQREAVPLALQNIQDIAISGNGEPTTAAEFEQVVDIIGQVLQQYELLHQVKCVLITNGSMIQRAQVQQGLQKLAKINGEVWFKIDSATAQGIDTINRIKDSKTAIIKRLKMVATLCPTFIQTCLFMYQDKEPSQIEADSYIDLLETIMRDQVPVQGLLLYGVERVSQQPEAANIKKLSDNYLQSYARRINNKVALNIKVTP